MKRTLAAISLIVFCILSSSLRAGTIAAQVCVPAPAGLIGWWPGDGNADDISGTGLNGILRDGVSFSPGEVDLGFDLDGIDDRVEIADAPALHFGTGDLTVDAWIKVPAGTSFRSVIGKEQQSFPFPQILLRINESGLLEFAVTDCGTGACGFSASGGGGSRQPVQSPARVDDDQFHHVAGVRHSTGYELYVDGQLVATRVEPARNGDNMVPLFIGIQAISAVDGSFFFPFDGIIDEVEIFNRALTAAEIQALFAAGSAGKCKDADGDGDGVDDSVDNCPNSIVSPTVIIGGCNSGVPNTVFPNGCTVSDLIQQCAADAQNHGQFVSCVSQLTNRLKRDGVITGQQKGAIQSCAAQSNIP